MDTQFLEYDEKAFWDFIMGLCLNAGFTPGDEHKVLGVANYINSIRNDMAIVSLLSKGLIKITDFSEECGFSFAMANEEAVRFDNLENSKIWKEISEIISSKEN
jgi:hypothetical protein